MKNFERIIYGLIITAVIFAAANIFGNKLHVNIAFFPDSFSTHTIMFLLSVIAIFIFRANLNYIISLPKFNFILKPAAIGILASIIINILMAVITKIAGGEAERHAFLSKMNPYQVIVFVFIYASVAEEILFRGFLMNLLKPLENIGINILKRRLSVPVIVSAIAFGLAHLILITTGAGFFFLLRIVLFTTILGLIAGYYQEKHNNNAYAIIVHMSGNLLAVLGAFLMNLNIQ